ncbi:hypothetical protein LCGC14_1178480 [marine sediment metagenome]|uniref:Uncharacterized protein n=1 Tax=marine sediment metagenome TaxID=412755 RepID=A0A0F9LMY3_9ZZZZ
MKFRAKKPNHYKDVQWTQGTVAEFTKEDVEQAIKKGLHITTDKHDKITKKPVSALLNHWSPMDKEAKEATSGFLRRIKR